MRFVLYRAKKWGKIQRKNCGKIYKEEKDRENERKNAKL